MSDSLASKTATLEQPSDKGQAERASEQRPQGTTDGQHSANGQAAQGTEQDNIRKLQSTYDKKLAEERKTFQAQQAQMQQHIQQLQREMREAKKNAAPDDFARLEIDLQEVLRERDQYAQAYQQLTQAQQADQARKAAIADILEDFDLVTAKELDEAIQEAGIATSERAYALSYKLAGKLQREKEQRKQQRDEERANANAPDVGSGAPRTAISDWEREWQAAAGNSLRQVELLRTQPKGAKR